MKTIAIANQKGGCAKTTTALNVAVTLTNTGSKVLAVDLDPQGNLSASLGVDLQELEENRHTSHRLMLDERGDFSSYVLNVRPRLDVLPACLDADAEAMKDYSDSDLRVILRHLMRQIERARATGKWTIAEIEGAESKTDE